MRRLIRPNKPAKLDELEQKLTQEFLADKTKSVWNKEYIRKTLLEMSNNKCAYCECYVGDGYKEMHIDHFHYKDQYPQEVVQWDNLIPSCPHCNKSKSTHDTYQTPIVNPCVDEPTDYFYMKNYRYMSKDVDINSKGRITIDILGLNDTDKKVMLRFQQGNQIATTIKDIYELAFENKTTLNTDVRKKNRVVRGCRNILKKALPDAEFASFIATIIHTEEDYLNLKQLMEQLNLWDTELEMLHQETKNIKYSITP